MVFIWYGSSDHVEHVLTELGIVICLRLWLKSKIAGQQCLFEEIFLIFAFLRTWALCPELPSNLSTVLNKYIHTVSACRQYIKRIWSTTFVSVLNPHSHSFRQYIRSHSLRKIQIEWFDIFQCVYLALCRGRVFLVNKIMSLWCIFWSHLQISNAIFGSRESEGQNIADIICKCSRLFGPQTCLLRSLILTLRAMYIKNFISSRTVPKRYICKILYDISFINL